MESSEPAYQGDNAKMRCFHWGIAEMDQRATQFGSLLSTEIENRLPMPFTMTSPSALRVPFIQCHPNKLEAAVEAAFVTRINQEAGEHSLILAVTFSISTNTFCALRGSSIQFNSLLTKSHRPTIPFVYRNPIWLSIIGELIPFKLNLPRYSLLAQWLNILFVPDW